MFNIQDELKNLPAKPGVYIMKDVSEKIIYIGKAKNLKNRVRQYFQKGNNYDYKTSVMVQYIKEFEYIITDNEVEALILECNLIKENSPKYNILLKDDKTYPFIKITLNEAYPRVILTRQHKKDKGKYFGPYTSAFDAKEIVEIIHKVWPIRDCKRVFPRDIGKERPCLNYYIEKCKAPCGSKITEEEYNKMIEEIISFLNGKETSIIKKLVKDMEELSEKLEFEKAAECRDKINIINKLKEKQKIEGNPDEVQDIIGLAKAHNEALVEVFFLRGGKIIGRENYTLSGVIDKPREEVIEEFIKQYYSETTFIPKEILIETEIEEKEVITEWLKSIKGSTVNIVVPKKGEKFKLVELASKNAVATLEQFGEKLKREKRRTEGAVQEIKEALKLEININRIEAYDISNMQGYESVGSMVVFENGKKKPSDYRKFKIKSVIGANDYGSIEEVIHRRLLRYKIEEMNNTVNSKFLKLPDVIFVDGGKGQITSVNKVLKIMDLDIPVCGMVKDDKHKTRGLLFKSEEINLPYTSEGFKLITRIQDEVHRFAIEYHRNLKGKLAVRSMLDDIKGIGTIRRKALIKHFGSIERIREATVEELSEVDSMDIRVAEEVYNFFKNKQKT